MRREALETIRDVIDDIEFLNRARKKPTDFTRERKMSFKKLIYFLLSMIKESSQNALGRYFRKIGEAVYMSQQGFSEARQKLKWEALKELFEITVEILCREIHRWHGFRLLAIDGTKLNLPNDPALREYFGTIGAGKSPCAQGSILYDGVNDIIVDARIEPMSYGEQKLAVEHIQKLAGMASFGKELVLFDRGYPSMELIRQLKELGIDFVMRVRGKFDEGIDGLPRGDHVIQLEKGGYEPETVRVVKFRLAGGETETLITSLTGTEYRTKLFKQLYFKRWGIETKYGEIKRKLEVENCSGRLVDNIRQDFYAALYLANRAGALYEQAQEEVEQAQRGSGHKWKYQVNVNHEIGVIKDRLIVLLLEDDREKRMAMFDRMIALLKKRLIPVRPNRSVPRKLARKVKFHHNHKSNC